MRWDGTSWSVVESPDPADEGNSFNAIAGPRDDELWAAGESVGNNTLLTLAAHWDGTNWTLADTPNIGLGDNSLLDVTAPSGEQAWAVGYYLDEQSQPRHLMLEWNGVDWRVSSLPKPELGGRLHGVAGLPDGEAWAVGSARVPGGTSPLALHHRCA
jgi:hypothetical protein